MTEDQLDALMITRLNEIATPNSDDFSFSHELVVAVCELRGATAAAGKLRRKGDVDRACPGIDCSGAGTAGRQREIGVL